MEPVGTGEPLRVRAAAAKGAGMPFAMLNSNKRAVTLKGTWRGREVYRMTDKLKDEIRDASIHPAAPVSYHAPVVASFAFPGD